MKDILPCLQKLRIFQVLKQKTFNRSCSTLKKIQNSKFCTTIIIFIKKHLL